MRRKTLLLVAVVALILTSAALILAATPAPKEPGKAYGKWMTLIIPQPDGTELREPVWRAEKTPRDLVASMSPETDPGIEPDQMACFVWLGNLPTGGCNGTCSGTGPLPPGTCCWICMDLGCRIAFSGPCPPEAGSGPPRCVKDGRICTK